ncbi:MAG: cysteine desulfurase NifS [Gemmatimonadales bacterium]|nr:Cysteine desulfurase NifS [bacterium HR33]GIW51553.1 MAG: cysteine desulfurase NifS [Gemmatimonadales bacterium]
MTGNAVYLDNAATTPLRPEVLQAMEPYLGGGLFGNPSSPHRFGRESRAGLNRARITIAEALGAEPKDVVFCSGGTEADNLAVLGAALAARARGDPFRVAVSAVEHKAVLAAAHTVEELGGECVVLPVDREGRLELEALDEALSRGVAVVSVMWVNNETGVIQDVPAIAARCREAGVPFHTDAVQAVGKVSCSAAIAGCTLLTVSAHKIGGPKGVGALIVRDRSAIAPLIRGGGQQGGLRPGTENVAGIAGLAEAVRLAVAEVEEFRHTVGRLRDLLEQRVLEAIPDATVNGAGAPRAPHVSNISIPGTDSEAMLMHLDLAGVACSSGSACTTGSVEPSHVLKAMGVPYERAIAALRFSLGRQNTEADVDFLLSRLPGIVGKVRSLAGVLGR